MNDLAGSGEENHLLKGLPDDTIERLRPHLEWIDAPVEMKMYDPYEKITDIHFPINSLASIVATTASGQSTEIGVVGNEGAVGLDALMGVDRSPHKSMIQIAGPIYRIDATYVADEFKRGGIFQHRLLHFIQKLSVQVSQTTLCNRLHNIDDRLARWLLMCDDRIKGDGLQLTQEFIALMLGANRVTVTQSATKLQDTGCIKYGRGRIKVLDREGLERSACECYQVVRKEYDRKYV
jgi:CRP-like cAMP-binding protein